MRVSPAAVALLLIGCGQAPVEPVLPPGIPPSWTRGPVHALIPDQLPKIIRDARLDRGWETEYRASDGATAVVDVYGLRSSAQGLDLVQRWHPERDQAQFYTEHFLLNIAWQKAPHDELAALVRSLPKLVEGK